MTMEQSTSTDGYFWHITDLHLDWAYSTKGDVAKSCWHMEHRQTNSPTHPPGHFGDYLCDSPWSLLESATQAMKSRQGDNVEFVLWTGVFHHFNANPSTKFSLIPLRPPKIKELQDLNYDCLSEIAKRCDLLSVINLKAAFKNSPTDFKDLRLTESNVSVGEAQGAIDPARQSFLPILRNLGNNFEIVEINLLTQSVLLDLSTNCSKIKHLTIKNVEDDIRTTQFELASRLFDKLVTLTIRNTKMPDAALKWLLTSPHLTSVVLEGFSDLKGNCIAEIKSKKLEIVNIGRCPQIKFDKIAGMRRKKRFRDIWIHYGCTYAAADTSLTLYGNYLEAARFSLVNMWMLNVQDLNLLLFQNLVSLEISGVDGSLQMGGQADILNSLKSLPKLQELVVDTVMY